MTGAVKRMLIAGLAIMASATTTFALTPMPRPQVADNIEAGVPEPFVGLWSMTLPTMEMGTPDADLATCDQPVRIEAAGDEHIFYLGPNDSEADAAIELSRRDNGTYWAPIAGGPTYFTLWIDEGMFYLYDAMPQTEADWGRPFVYRRCD
ncbi:MAG: hypothetical protein IR164_10130 [Devosia sp.]|jgi:hypothetical protein|uniref:hypothetical protein n=1 Tax=Devosia sp. TaxID=1871048 RepID=UPI0019F405F6|nr:hypothetical protein [Devosia sp.]MBF0679284.1 hypothetical protein [Devosia sp.]